MSSPSESPRTDPPAADRVIDRVTDPAADPATEPTIDRVTAPAADRDTESSSDPVTDPVASTPPTGLDAVGALAEPNRRRLYEFVVEQADWVSRDQAAEASGLRRGIVAHHLDRLVDDGLLVVEHRRLTGRQGPGAGRPAKLYRRAPVEVSVSLPPRHYDLAGRVLSAATDAAISGDVPIAEALDEVATDTGRAIGRDGLATQAARVGSDGPAPGKDRHGVLTSTLCAWGFEPRLAEDGSTVLGNCPFHQLAVHHTELICGMNLRLVEGVVEGVGVDDVEPRLDPHADTCCVRLVPRVEPS